MYPMIGLSLVLLTVLLFAAFGLVRRRLPRSGAHLRRRCGFAGSAAGIKVARANLGCLA